MKKGAYTGITRQVTLSTDPQRDQEVLYELTDTV